MSEPISAAQKNRIIDEISRDFYTLYSRLSTVEAERDAAVMQLSAVQIERALEKPLHIAEGQRRATAAIVEDLRSAKPWHGVDPHTSTYLAARYERGDHLPRAGDAGEG